MTQRRQNVLLSITFGPRAVSSLPASPPLGLVFQLCRRDRLPLHVGRRIRAATRQRYDVIDDVAWSTFGESRLPRKRVSCRRAPLDAALLIPGHRNGRLRARLTLWLARGGFLRRLGLASLRL